MQRDPLLRLDDSVKPTEFWTVSEESDNAVKPPVILDESVEDYFHRMARYTR